MHNIAALNVESCCAPRAPRLPKFTLVYTRSEIHIFSLSLSRYVSLYSLISLAILPLVLIGIKPSSSASNSVLLTPGSDFNLSKPSSQSTVISPWFIKTASPAKITFDFSSSTPSQGTSSGKQRNKHFLVHVRMDEPIVTEDFLPFMSVNVIAA